MKNWLFVWSCWHFLVMHLLRVAVPQGSIRLEGRVLLAALLFPGVVARRLGRQLSPPESGRLDGGRLLRIRSQIRIDLWRQGILFRRIQRGLRSGRRLINAKLMAVPNASFASPTTTNVSLLPIQNLLTGESPLGLFLRLRMLRPWSRRVRWLWKTARPVARG